MTTSVHTPFSPRLHGFAFPNAFPVGKPVYRVRTPFGGVPVGDASKGLCGGMVFAALDHHRLGRPLPADPDTPDLFDYLVRRLWASFRLPWGPARIYRWTASPDVSSLTAAEWPKVRAELDAGRPAPLMLIKAASRNPWALGLNHQILATGYAIDSAGGVTLTLYEPNYPLSAATDEPVELRFATLESAGGAVYHSREGESVRGFFLNPYTPAVPPPWR
jgi:hypothetical protein